MRARRWVVSLAAALAVTIGATVVVQTVVEPAVITPAVAGAPVTPTGSPSQATADRTPLPAPSVGLETIASGRLASATFPERRIEQALLVAGAAEAAPGHSPTIVAVDAATGDWVRAIVPGMPMFAAPQLSPDGRSLVVQSGDLGMTVSVVRFSDGTSRELPFTFVADDECRLDGVAWTPDSRHVVLVIGCATFGRETMEVTDMNTWVLEVDVATGASRTIEHLIGGFPSEAYPTVSPDGRTVVYGVGMETDDETSLGGIRAVDRRTSEARHWPDLHLTYGDPWRDDATVLAWDQSWEGTSDEYVLVDTRSGTTSPLGITSLFGVSGYVGGRLAVERTPWLDRTPPCAVTYCLADPESLAISPWLELPENSRLGLLSPARGLLG